MPTQRKIQSVAQLRELIEGCTIAISADNTAMTVGAMTALRRALREKGVKFRVVKNTLTYLAADAAGKPLIKDIVQGPTGIAFGFDDPTTPAKALTGFINSTRAPLRIRGAVLGDRFLTQEDVVALAALPTKEELLARLLGQLQSPITGLAYVLSAPVAALARVLQRAVEATGEGDQSSSAPGPGSQGRSNAESPIG